MRRIQATMICVLGMQLSSLARAFLRTSAASGHDATQEEARGIVMSCPAAGGTGADPADWKPKDLYTGFVIAAVGLRKMGCQLPIYNMVYKHELVSIQQRCKELNDRIGGVSCAGMEEDASESGYGYSKVFAVKLAPVNQVMFLDCDAFFARDPTYMFDDPSFIATGALFWADIEGNFGSDGHLDAAMAVLPAEKKKFADEWWFRQGYDSALLLIDKKVAKKPFGFLLEMLTTSSKKYDLDAMSWGDKDLWHVAWLAKGPACHDKTCSLMPWAAAIGDCEEYRDCHICSQAKLDRQGEVLAIHQIWTMWNGGHIPPSTLISFNIFGKSAADAQGPYPNDNFYGFHGGITISSHSVKEELSEKDVTSVPSNIQTLISETFKCWHLDGDGRNCTFSAI